MSKNGLYTFGSLFCGCGGFDQGFIDAGYRCLAAFDSDPLAIETHRINLGSAAQIWDLSSHPYPLEQLRNVDVLLAGPPCQGFSTIGKRQVNDPRNLLLLAAGRIAAILRPRVVVVENVRGVKSGAHNQYWESLDETLVCAGYRTAQFLCDTSLHGVAQIRKRMILLAWRRPIDVTIKLPPTERRVLRQALQSLNGAPNHTRRFLQEGSPLDKVAKRIKPGQKLSNVRGGPSAIHTWDIPEVYGKTNKTERHVLHNVLLARRRHRVRDEGDADPVTPNRLDKAAGFRTGEIVRSLIRKGYLRNVRGRIDLVHTFNGKFRRLEWDRPSHTVDTRFGDPRCFLHPEENRGFTVREAARIQGFPDDFLFFGRDSNQFRLIGNAVPPPVAEVLATFVRYAILNR